MKCPGCSNDLGARPIYSGTAWTCGSCRGVLLEPPALRVHLDTGTIARLWERAEAGPLSAERSCPACDRPFRVWKEPVDGGAIELDACAPCGRLWFDGGEIDKLNASARRSGSVSRVRSDSESGGGRVWRGVQVLDALGALIGGVVDS